MLVRPLLVGGILCAGGISAGATDSSHGTALPAGEQCIETVADGGLENTDGTTIWRQESMAFGSPVCSVDLCGGPEPRSGSWHAWFGGTTGAETSFIEQDVTLPVGASAELVFWLEIQGTALDAPGELTVSLDDNVLLRADFSRGARPYERRAFDVSRFADGLTYTLRFAFDNGGGDPTDRTSFLVDDISLEVCTTSVPPLLRTQTEHLLGLRSDAADQNSDAVLDSADVVMALRNS